MLVGLVNKGNLHKSHDKKPFEKNTELQLPPSRVRFSHLEELTKLNSPINSPRSISIINESEKKIDSVFGQKTPNFKLNKDKQLNRFLSNAKLANQMTHIIDMEDQVLYIGIIGNNLIERYSHELWWIKKNGICF